VQPVNELLLVLDLDEGTTPERTDVAVREIEDYLRTVPEATDFTSYVGLASPMDFNGMVRHYCLRRGPNVAEVRLNLVGKKSRPDKSHAIDLRLRDDLTAIAKRHRANLKIVETPPGPPVIASIVVEVYGRPDHTYDDLVAAAKTVRARLEREPGVTALTTPLQRRPQASPPPPTPPQTQQQARSGHPSFLGSPLDNLDAPAVGSQCASTLW
jgi:multidrug efflux pump subunit AcrB